MAKQFGWMFIEALCATFGCAIGLLFMMFTMIASSTLFIFIATVLIVIGGAYAIKFIILLYNIDHDDIDYLVGGKTVMKDTFKEPKPWKYSIIAFIIVTLCVIGGFWEIQRSVLEKWNEKCKQYGLAAECTDADICEVSCEKLNKNYYVYKPGRQDECWCRVGDSTERIY